MKHARSDYSRIQDPAGLIPADEPVFLLRGQDRFAPEIVRQYAALVQANARSEGDVRLSRLCQRHADQMDEWQEQRGSKFPDTPGVNDSSIPAESDH